MAADMLALFQYIVHAGRIDVVVRGNVVLKLTIPMPQPYIDSVIKGQRAALIFGIIVCRLLYLVGPLF